MSQRANYHLNAPGPRASAGNTERLDRSADGYAYVRRGRGAGRRLVEVKWRSMNISLAFASQSLCSLAFDLTVYRAVARPRIPDPNPIEPRTGVSKNSDGLSNT